MYGEGVVGKGVLVELTNMHKGKGERKKNQINHEKEKKEIQPETYKACQISPNCNKSTGEIVSL